jgi:hypothetical protein
MLIGERLAFFNLPVQDVYLTPESRFLATNNVDGNGSFRSETGKSKKNPLKGFGRC